MSTKKRMPWRHLAPMFLLSALAGLGSAHAQVGLARLTVGELPVTLVYPTAETARPVRYGPFELNVAPDAVPRPGLHRLVVMSHGTGGNPWSDHTLAATLARAGFVVAQPQHQGDNHLDSSGAGPVSFARRPGEVSRVIDALARHPGWKALVQTDRVGVHGMSAGGVTGLALAGAQWRVLSLATHCRDHGEDDLGFCYAGAPGADAQAARRQQFEMLRDAPEDRLPEAVRTWQGGRSEGEVRPDPRVVSVSISVPVAALFSSESLARIRVPVGVVTAGKDRMLLPAYHSQKVLKDCSACTLLADLTGAGHMDLLSPWPAEVAQAVARAHPRGAVTEPGLDPAQRQAAFELIAAFHRQQLPVAP